MRIYSTIRIVSHTNNVKSAPLDTHNYNTHPK